MNFHHRNKHQLAIKTKNGETRTRCIIAFLSCIGCILLCLYFGEFHNGFSTNQDDWGNFGSYICGIASIFNVIIFTWLTISIQRAGDEERKKDREHKQLLLITQIRKEELINLEKTLNETLQITDLYLPAFFKYQNAQSYLLNYAQSHKALFPLLDDKDVEQIFVNASSKLRIMRIEAMKSLGFNEIGETIDDQTPISNTVIEASKEFEQLKIIIISKLEEYIINQINC